MSLSARLTAWVKSHPYHAVWAVAIVVLAVPSYLRPESEWEEDCVRGAERIAAGQPLYRPGAEVYLYPPFMATAALPFTYLSASVGRALWVALNLACLVFLVAGAWRLAGGGALAGSPRREHVAAVLGADCGLGYAQNCFAHQQMDVVIGALLVGGCLLLLRERFLAGATCLGLAAACKCSPLLFLPYLLYRRRPAAAVWLLAVAVGVNLLPELLYPSPSGRPRLAEYWTFFLQPLMQPHHQVGTWGSEIVYNQSLAGACQRWLATTWAWGAAELAVQARPPLVGPQAMKAVTYGGSLLLLLGAMWAAGRPFRPVRRAAPGEVPPQALECGMVLALALLLSPMSSKAHFGVLVVPGFCLARAALGSPGRLARLALGAAVALALVSNKGPLGTRLATLTLWYGTTTLATLVLLIGCAGLLWRRRDAAAVAPALGANRAPAQAA